MGTYPYQWNRSDGSIRVDVPTPPARHVDVSVDGGQTWDALRPDEARAMAKALRRSARFVDPWTLGSMQLGLRIARGKLDRHGRFHDNRPNVFLLWRDQRGG